MGYVCRRNLCLSISLDVAELLLASIRFILSSLLSQQLTQSFTLTENPKHTVHAMKKAYGYIVLCIDFHRAGEGK